MIRVAVAVCRVVPIISCCLRRTRDDTSILAFTRFGIAGKTIALSTEDKEKEVAFEANEVRVEWRAVVKVQQ